MVSYRVKGVYNACDVSLTRRYDAELKEWLSIYVPVLLAADLKFE